jgi:hypothetical protein
LSSGTVKILIGYASYTLGGTGDVGFSTQNLSQPVDFVQDTDAISTVEVGSGLPQNTDVTLGIDGEIVPINGPTPDPGDPSLVEPIPDGEYEPINVNDFENTIQPGQDTVITL